MINRLPGFRHNLHSPRRAAVALIVSSILTGCATTQTNETPLAEIAPAPVTPMLLNFAQSAYLLAACSAFGSTNPWHWPSTPQGLHLSSRARTESSGVELSAYINSLPQLILSVCNENIISLANMSAERAAAIHDLLTAYYNRPIGNDPFTLGSPQFATRHALERPLLQSMLTILERIIQDRD